MTCLTCEIGRAKTYAGARAVFNTETLIELANRLTQRYGVEYYVVNDSLYRTNQIAPHVPYQIWPLF